MSNAVFITGAATGIGRATAHRLSTGGFRVFAGVLPDQMPGYEGSATRVPVPIDVTDPASVHAAREAVRAQVGRGGLRVLINNAGVANLGSGPVAGCSLEETERLFAINVHGTLRVTQAFLPLLHEATDARILNLSSGAVAVPVPFSATYNMTKAAVEGLTRTLRLELAPFGIQATSIRPGAVATPMTDGAQGNIRGVWDRMPAWVRRVYEPVLRPANRALIERLETKANPPERIAEGIERAIRAPRMKASYLVGREVRLLPIIERLLPEPQLESIFLREMGLRRNTAPPIERPVDSMSLETRSVS